jgi:hypothetical protein
MAISRKAVDECLSSEIDVPTLLYIIAVDGAIIEDWGGAGEDETMAKLVINSIEAQNESGVSVCVDLVSALREITKAQIVYDKRKAKSRK